MIFLTHDLKNAPGPIVSGAFLIIYVFKFHRSVLRFSVKEENQDQICLGFPTIFFDFVGILRERIRCSLQ